MSTSLEAAVLLLVGDAAVAARVASDTGLRTPVSNTELHAALKAAG